MKTIVKFSLLTAITVMIATSCCNCKKGSPKIGDLEESSWLLVEYDGQKVDNSGIILNFDGETKMIHGKAPCNGFFGGYSLLEDKNQNFKVGNIGMTRRYCPDAQLEEQFTSKLSSVVNVRIDGGNMLMLDAEGNLVAVLAPQAKIK